MRNFVYVSHNPDISVCYLNRKRNILYGLENCFKYYHCYENQFHNGKCDW